MISDFDIVFDEICSDVFPKIDGYIETIEDDKDYVEVHDLIEFLTDVEGYDTDMAQRIWDSYQTSSRHQNLLHRKADA